MNGEIIYVKYFAFKVRKSCLKLNKSVQGFIFVLIYWKKTHTIGGIIFALKQAS